VQRIDVSRMDHVIPGQITKRFFLAQDSLQAAGENNDNGGLNLTGGVETAQELSLSLLYRDATGSGGGGTSSSSSNTKERSTNLFQRNSSSTGDKKKHNINKHLSNDKKHRTLETLDLIIPSSQQFKDLLHALKDILAMYGKVRSQTDQTTLLLEYLWMDMGKEDLTATLSQTEWLDVCDRLNVPLKRNLCSTLFREVSKQVPNKSSRFVGGKNGLPLWAVAELLNDVRFHYLDEAGLKPVSQDPMLRLWYELLTTDPVPALKSGQKPPEPKNEGTIQLDATELVQSISSVAFLSFLRAKQREYNITLEDAVDRIKFLNNKYGSNSNSNEKSSSSPTNNITGNERLSKTKFFQFLLSDANDLLDPQRGKVGSDDMTHPLSHYWICSSHDTYMNHWNNYGQVEYDEHMYLAALYRGVRSLELDIWDNCNDTEPIICRKEPRSADETHLKVERVLKVVRQYLLAHPKCYPVILNIENHCSFKNQERLANILFQILGKSGLIVVPDDTASIDEADLLPSPQAMRGKVLILGKRPKVIQDGAKVINDDFDDENDHYDADELPTVLSREEDEGDLDQGIVIGFDAAGPIKAGKKHEKQIVQHSSGELLYMAQQDFEQAKMDAAKAELSAFNLSEEADRAETTADDLIEQAGLNKDTILELASHVRGDTIDPTDQTLLACRAEGEGVEVQDFFADGVDAARKAYTEAEQWAIEAAADATDALQKLNQITDKLRDAEGKLEASYTKERTQVADYRNAAAEARARREDANFAQKRFEKVQVLLEECEDSANSAENVVVTAMTEAKISEKRAQETEARAARAAAKAAEDRKQADEETKKEEALEREASVLHDKLSEVVNRVKEKRADVDNCTALIGRVTEQIKLIESSTQYRREVKEKQLGVAEEKKDSGNGGKVLSKYESKLEERRALSLTIQKARGELSKVEKQQQKIKDEFEKKAHVWKAQTGSATQKRKTADRSAHVAEELAEHADEEREAANLRLVAREKAKTNVTQKDGYRESLQAQVKEAERAAKEAEIKAQQAKSKADALEYVNDDLPTHDKNVRLVEKRKEVRDRLLADYHAKKKIKEEEEKRVDETKRTFETSEHVFSQAMRNAAKDEHKADYQRQKDRNALIAFNQARFLRKQAEHALEDVRYAQSTVTERQMIIKRATEYSEKMARITPIPTSLAKMTFLHSTKHRHWDKSFDIPNTHVHSFAQGVLDNMKEKDPKNHDRLKDFTTEHLCRTFPSWKDMRGRDKINSEPLFLWALGCQMVSLNYGTFDEHILKADGRFRRNGSSGYVLKPENLTHDDPLREGEETWSIDVLSGSCLPSPESTKKTLINLFVKVVVYGGDIEGKKAEHRTKVVMKNGINPIWDEKSSGIKFMSRNPSLSLCVFTVWHKGEHGEDFIAGAALPLSSMREGFRSVALFDAYHTRAGAHAYASLLVKVSKSRK
jgi:hypothetical protein